MDTIEKSGFHPGDIIMNPKNKTTMWRVLDVQDNQTKIIRCGKEGNLHGLVKNPEGTWIVSSELAKFNVTGHTTVPLIVKARSAKSVSEPTTKKKPGPKPKATSVKGSYNAPQQLGRAKPGPKPGSKNKPNVSGGFTAVGGNDRNLVKFLESTLKNLKELAIAR